MKYVPNKLGYETKKKIGYTDMLAFIAGKKQRADYDTRQDDIADYCNLSHDIVHEEFSNARDYYTESIKENRKERTKIYARLTAFRHISKHADVYQDFTDNSFVMILHGYEIIRYYENGIIRLTHGLLSDGYGLRLKQYRTPASFWKGLPSLYTMRHWYTFTNVNCWTSNRTAYVSTGKELIAYASSKRGESFHIDEIFITPSGKIFKTYLQAEIRVNAEKQVQESGLTNIKWIREKIAENLMEGYNGGWIYVGSVRGIYPMARQYDLAVSANSPYLMEDELENLPDNAASIDEAFENALNDYLADYGLMLTSPDTDDSALGVYITFNGYTGNDLQMAENRANFEAWSKKHYS